MQPYILAVAGDRRRGEAQPVKPVGEVGPAPSVTTTLRCPEVIAAGVGYSHCHKHPGHRGPHHAAGRTWHDSGDLGQQLRLGIPCDRDCQPLPAPPLVAARTTVSQLTDWRDRYAGDVTWPVEEFEPELPDHWINRRISGGRAA